MSRWKYSHHNFGPGRLIGAVESTKNLGGEVDCSYDSIMISVYWKLSKSAVV